MRFFVALFFTSVFFANAQAAGGACQSVFLTEATPNLPTLELDFTTLTHQQNFISRKFQKAEAVSENRVYNETMTEIAVTLNQMLDPYVEAILYFKKYPTDPEGQKLLLTFIKTNEVFFLKLLSNNKQALAQLLTLRATVIEADRQSTPLTQPIGFYHPKENPSATPQQSRSIGFLETSSSPEGKPLETIGFVQDQTKQNEPAQKLPTIGFVQPHQKESVTPKEQVRADVGYRLNLIIHPTYGHFELIKPTAP